MTALDRYTVRPFDPAGDMADAYDCFVSSFHHILWPIVDHADRALVEDIILTANLMSFASFVAEVDGRTRGLIIAGLPFEAAEVAKSAGRFFSFNARWFAGRERRLARPFARACLRRVIAGYLPFLFRHPLSPSSTETLMLASHEEYRGGIGRVMMDEVVRASRVRGYGTTTVCTDSMLSWDFYERYGFTRVREFPLSAYAYSLPAEDVRGFIYSLDIG